MKVLDLLDMIHELDRKKNKRIFSIREIAALGRASRAAAGMALLRAKQKGLVARIGNLWVNRKAPPLLQEIAFSLQSPSYISFESALYHHGILSQSPRGALTIATLGRPKRVATHWGDIQFIHLKSDLFFGFDRNRMASPEKAWLDLLYIRRRQGETTFSEQFYLDRLNAKKIAQSAKKFPPFIRKIANEEFWYG